LQQARLEQADLQKSVQIRQSELSSAKTRIAELRQELASSGVRVSTLERQIQEAKAQRSELQRSFASRETDLASARSRIDQLTKALATSEQRVGSLQQDLEASKAQRAELRESVDNRQTDLASANAKIEDLSRELQLSTEALRSMQQRIERAKSDRLQLKAAYERQRQELAAARRQVVQLDETLSSQARKLRDLRQQRTQAEQETQQTEQILANVRGNYDSLRVKYNRLVQPARSPEGKHVVEVRFDKGTDGYDFGLKEPGDATFSSITRGALEDRLSALKKRHADDLYVRIIIPDTTELSYREAWDYTNEILSRFDYYYQTPGRQPSDEVR
jgi:chromosome segregation ATPase